ncbi:MAG: flavodoxin domain-containing protein, partial [Planctomycetota bacterium]
MASQFVSFAKQLDPNVLSGQLRTPIPVTILWGSQSGNAEGLAARLAEDLSQHHCETSAIEMIDYDVSKLPEEQNLLIVTSTYGDGEPPDNAVDFMEALFSESAPRADGVKFSVLALGDSQYPDFCQAGKDIDSRLEELGAERIYDRVECDVDFEEPFKVWKTGLLDFFVENPTEAFPPDKSSKIHGYGPENPFPAKILNNFNLNGVGSVKSTHHIEVSIAGSGLKYEIGDALGIHPLNDCRVVDEIIDATPFAPETLVPIPNGGVAFLRDALVEHYDIQTLNRNLVTAWQERSDSQQLRSIVEEDRKEKWQEFFWGRGVIDLVVDHPARFMDAAEFVRLLKRLQPRQYSISSSPRVHPDEVHLTVSVVRYQSHGRMRGGVCSTYLADQSNDVPPKVFVQVNKGFRPPEDDDAPMIMVGPGTGIAPF